MNSKTHLLILKNRLKLEKLIEDNAPYEKILYQSKHLDKYINMKMNEINPKK